MSRHASERNSSSDESDPRHTCTRWRRCRSPRERSRERCRPVSSDASGFGSDQTVDSDKPFMSGALPRAGGFASDAASSEQRTRADHTLECEPNSPWHTHEMRGRPCRCRRCSQRAGSGDERSSDLAEPRARIDRRQPLKGILKKPSQDGAPRLGKSVSFSSDKGTGINQQRREAAAASILRRASDIADWLRPGPKQEERDRFEGNNESEGDADIDRKALIGGGYGEESGIGTRDDHGEAPKRCSHVLNTAAHHDEHGSHTIRLMGIISNSDIGRVQHDMLHTHQVWCRGDCADATKFVHDLGACTTCAGMIKAPVQPSARCGSIPLCRTWIHCCSKRTAREVVFGSDRHKSNENALRVGFADAYVCEMRGFIGVEAYLAFLKHDLHEETLFEWLLEPDFKQALDHVTRSGWHGFQGRLGCQQLEFLRHTAAEAGKTSELWTVVQAEMAERGEGMLQRSLKRLVDGWIYGWRIGARRRSRPRLH